jgi:hypothetical protein
MSTSTAVKKAVFAYSETGAVAPQARAWPTDRRHVQSCRRDVPFGEERKTMKHNHEKGKSLARRCADPRPAPGARGSATGGCAEPRAALRRKKWESPMATGAHPPLIGARYDFPFSLRGGVFPWSGLVEKSEKSANWRGGIEEGGKGQSRRTRAREHARSADASALPGPESVSTATTLQRGLRTRQGHRDLCQRPQSRRASTCEEAGESASSRGLQARSGKKTSHFTRP